jgi:hypothetical protein
MSAKLQTIEQKKRGYNPETQLAWYEKNKEKKRSYMIARYAKDPSRQLAASKKRREEHPGCWTESHLKVRYGITLGEYITMRVSQFDQCAICSKSFDNRKKGTKPHIDHDHATGKVRGILCGPCNISLGHLEKHGFLSQALGYLGANA